jgi:DNA-binding NarL/FixJ family response regulator
MANNNGTKKSSTLTIVVKLKSLLFCEALCKSMSKEFSNYRIYRAGDVVTLRNFKPDLTLTDYVNLNQELYFKWPDTKVILIDTGVPEEDIAVLMRSYKLYGILSTEEDFQHLDKALQVVNEGQIWIDNGKLKAILHGNNCSSPTEVFDKISAKESRIIELVAQGYKNREIASMLFLSEQTIKSHLVRIYKKMRISNRSQLVSLTIKKKSSICP